jgi:hypothetical protein
MPRKPIGDQAMTDAERQRRRRERLRKERGAAPEKPAGKAAPASPETGRGAGGNREVAPAPRPVGEVSASLNLTERRFRSFWDQTCRHRHASAGRPSGQAQAEVRPLCVNPATAGKLAAALPGFAQCAGQSVAGLFDTDATL